MREPSLFYGTVDDRMSTSIHITTLFMCEVLPSNSLLTCMRRKAWIFFLRQSGLIEFRLKTSHFYFKYLFPLKVKWLSLEFLRNLVKLTLNGKENKSVASEYILTFIKSFQKHFQKIYFDYVLYTLLSSSLKTSAYQTFEYIALLKFFICNAQF